MMIYLINHQVLTLIFFYSFMKVITNFIVIVFNYLITIFISKDCLQIVFVFCNYHHIILSFFIIIILKIVTINQYYLIHEEFEQILNIPVNISVINPFLFFKVKIFYLLIILLNPDDHILTLYDDFSYHMIIFQVAFVVNLLFVKNFYNLIVHLITHLLTYVIFFHKIP